MTFFVDANIIVYANSPSPQRARCLEIVRAIVARRADGRTSPAVLQEIEHLELSGRVRGLRGAARDAYEWFTPLLAITDEAARLALDLDAPRLQAMDRLHVGTCRSHGIEVIVSADTGFDAVAGLRRVDPLDDAGIRSLIAA